MSRIALLFLIASSIRPAIAAEFKIPSLGEAWSSVKSRYSECKPTQGTPVLWKCTQADHTVTISIRNNQVQVARLIFNEPPQAKIQTFFKASGWRLVGPARDRFGTKDVVDHSRWIESPKQSLKVKISSTGTILEIHSQKVLGKAHQTLKQVLEARL